MGHLRLRALDGLRGLAVLGVVAHHASLLPLNVGAHGVELFFVISGFCLSLPTLQRAQGGRAFAFDVKHFAIGRIARIVPPYYVALSLFVALSLTSFGVPSVLAPPIRFEWLLDAFFITGDAPAYNASFWTLGVEARWYLVFPAVLRLYARSKRGFALLGIACYGASLLWNSPLDVGILPCFMLGIVAADVFVRGKAGSPGFGIAAAVALALAIASDHTVNPASPLWHAAAFFLVLAGVGMGARLMSWRPLAFIGTASYSIYLVHQPILLWLGHFRLPWPLLALVSVACGIAFWRLVEIPSLALTRALRARPAPASMPVSA